jgi:hypothetical protein
LFRVSRRDAILVGAALAHGLLVVIAALQFHSLRVAPALAFLFAIGLWWSSNTVSHLHLHNPVFRAPGLNRLLSLYLTALLGIPQSIWRARHMWHHAGEPARRPRLVGGVALVEIALVVIVCALLAWQLPQFLFAVMLPGWLMGLLLCHAQGVFEHRGAGAGGISFYNRVYNVLWFNDGYHAEHHRHPGEHWSRLPARRTDGDAVSPLPPVARFLEAPLAWANRVQARVLVLLERLALASTPLQRFMLATHDRAFARLLPLIAKQRALESICVVGGGLFPRTAIILAARLPDCRVTLLDRSADNLAIAAEALRARGIPLTRIELAAGDLDLAMLARFDAVVIPLGLVGDRDALYRAAARPGAPAILIHDWLHRVRGRAGRRISWLLLKRLNLA